MTAAASSPFMNAMNASRFVVGTIAEQNRILADRGIQIGWDDPARTFRLLDDLREGYEPKLGVAGVDELEGLRDAAALYDLIAERRKY